MFFEFCLLCIVDVIVGCLCVCVCVWWGAEREGGVHLLLLKTEEADKSPQIPQHPPTLLVSQQQRVTAPVTPALVLSH